MLLFIFHEIPICKHQFYSTVNNNRTIYKMSKSFFLSLFPFDSNIFPSIRIFFLRFLLFYFFFPDYIFRLNFRLFAKSFSTSEKNSIWFDGIVHLGTRGSARFTECARARSHFQFMNDSQVAHNVVSAIYFRSRNITNSIHILLSHAVECQKLFWLFHCFRSHTHTKKWKFHHEILHRFARFISVCLYWKLRDNE